MRQNDALGIRGQAIWRRPPYWPTLNLDNRRCLPEKYLITCLGTKCRKHTIRLWNKTLKGGFYLNRIGQS